METARLACLKERSLWYVDQRIAPFLGSRIEFDCCEWRNNQLRSLSMKTRRNDYIGSSPAFRDRISSAAAIGWTALRNAVSTRKGVLRLSLWMPRNVLPQRQKKPCIATVGCYGGTLQKSPKYLISLWLLVLAEWTGLTSDVLSLALRAHFVRPNLVLSSASCLTKHSGLRLPWLRRSAGQSHALAITASPRRICQTG